MSERKIVDAKKDGNKIYFKGHAKATYMSDGRTVEDAINSNTGGSSSGGAYPIVKLDSMNSEYTIQPNIFYHWDDFMESLDITFGEEIEGVVNEYIFQFRLYKDFVGVTLPDILWVNDKQPVFEAGKEYQISIVNGIGCFIESNSNIKGWWEEN